jgi:hypothetical protein
MDLVQCEESRSRNSPNCDRRVHGPVREPAVTARVTTLQGDDAGAYYVEGPRTYYLDGDEPPGRWGERQGLRCSGSKARSTTPTSSP